MKTLVSNDLNFVYVNWACSGARLALFSLQESLFCSLGVLAKVWDVEMREFYAGYRLSSVTILWAELTKRSKEIFCSWNLVAPRDFYDAWRTFYASSYEILVEKNAILVEKKMRDAPLFLLKLLACMLHAFVVQLLIFLSSLTVMFIQSYYAACRTLTLTV